MTSNENGNTSPSGIWIAGIAIVAAVAAAWYAYQTQQKNRADWQAWQQQYQTQQEKNQQEQAQLTQRIKQLQDHIDSANQAQENLRAIVAGGAERFAEAQRMHAAEYFVFEAEKILMLAQDVPAAAKLLETADSELQGSNEQSAQQLRAAVQRDRQHLQGLSQVDALAVARQLSEIQTRIDGLRSIAPVLKEKMPTTQYDAEQDTWWGQFKANVLRFSGDWFLVREHAHDVEAPLNDLEARQVKQAITLSLANAQAAALRHEQGLYYNAVTQAYELLTRHYGSDANGVALAEQLQSLTQKLVSVTATISLQSAQSLRNEKVSTEATP